MLDTVIWSTQFENVCGSRYSVERQYCFEESFEARLTLFKTIIFKLHTNRGVPDHTMVSGYALCLRSLVSVMYVCSSSAALDVVCPLREVGTCERQLVRVMLIADIGGGNENLPWGGGRCSVAP